MRTETSTVAPKYGKAWTHPSTGEVRYYINNVWEIATARRGKAWIANGQLHTTDDMHYTTEAKIQAAVDAHPMVTEQVSMDSDHDAKQWWEGLTETDLSERLSKMMDRGDI